MSNSLLDNVCAGADLTQTDTYKLFQSLVRGDLEPVEIAAYLIALKAKGECPAEIAGAAQALRESASPFPRPDYRFADSCGTGGDGANTLNISTAVALVAAEIGIPIAKHGNRSVSSRSGSADVLEALGIPVDLPPAGVRQSLDDCAFGFLFAPRYHPGLHHAMPVRKALRTRTIFNVLGPLVNPARPTVQVVGVYAPALCRPLAETLGLLGCEAALVVHGSGLDEIALHGPTIVARLRDGVVEEFTLTPEDAGLPRYPLEGIRGGEPAENARALERLFEGKGEPAHEAAVALNAGALVMVFARASDLHEGTRIALEALRSGRIAARVQRLREVAHAGA